MCAFKCAFLCSSVRLVTRSFHSFVRGCARLSVRSYARPFVSFVCAWMCAFKCAFICSSVHLVTHSLLHTFLAFFML